MNGCLLPLAMMFVLLAGMGCTCEKAVQKIVENTQGNLGVTSKGALSMLKETKVSNGMELITYESHKVPLVTLVLTVKAGAMTETPETNGLTHVWEHMFFKGNQRLPDQEAFKKRMRELGIVFNGDTSAEKVRYYFTMPSGYLEEGIQFMADAIATPLLDKKELEREVIVVLNEYERSASSPRFDLQNLRRHVLYGEKEYLRDPMGTIASIKSVNEKKLMEIKNDVMVPSNSALIVAGDVDPAEVKRLTEKHFEIWQDPEGWKPKDPVAVRKIDKAQDLKMIRKHVAKPSVIMTIEGPKARENPAATYAADILSSLIDHRDGKFYKKFIDSGLALDAGVYYYTQSHAGQVVFYFSCEPENLNKLQTMIQAEIGEWQKDGYFTDSQLEDVHRSLRISHKQQTASPSSFGKQLGFWWAITGLDYLRTYLDKMQATGLADVQAFVKEWLVDKPVVTATIVSPEDAKKIGFESNTLAAEKELLQPHYGQTATMEAAQ
jgi:zinc protease